MCWFVQVRLADADRCFKVKLTHVLHQNQELLHQKEELLRSKRELVAGRCAEEREMLELKSRLSSAGAHPCIPHTDSFHSQGVVDDGDLVNEGVMVQASSSVVTGYRSLSFECECVLWKEYRWGRRICRPF